MKHDHSTTCEQQRTQDRSWSENDRLKANAKTAALNDDIHKKNAEHRQKEILRLQAELLASQERVYELQAKLLSLREIVNVT
jgi:predicted RNase H-like nuclease (RuvC/YqgF family)